MNQDFDCGTVRANEGQANDGHRTPDREDAGLEALESPSLEKQAALVSRQIDESCLIQDEAVGLAQRSARASRGPQVGTHHALAH